MDKHDYLAIKAIKEDTTTTIRNAQARMERLGVPAEWFYTTIRRALRANMASQSSRIRNSQYRDFLTNETPQQAMKAYREAKKGMPRSWVNEWKEVLDHYLTPPESKSHIGNSLRHNVVKAVTKDVVYALQLSHETRRELRAREKFRPVRSVRDRMENDAERAFVNTVTSWRPMFYIPLPTDSEEHRSVREGRGGVVKLSIGWKRQTDALGSTSIGARFIARADLVDQIGEYDLFQIEFYEGNERALQHGFVARYRGTNVRGFGKKPETALQWTRRQVLVGAQRKMGVL